MRLHQLAGIQTETNETLSSPQHLHALLRPSNQRAFSHHITYVTVISHAEISIGNEFNGQITLSDPLFEKFYRLRLFSLGNHLTFSIIFTPEYENICISLW